MYWMNSLLLITDLSITPQSLHLPPQTLPKASFTVNTLFKANIC